MTRCPAKKARGPTAAVVHRVPVKGLGETRDRSASARAVRATPALARASPLRLVIEPTPNGRKWFARLNDRVICVSVWPFVLSARRLLAEGCPADTVIEAWRPNTDEWAMRGRLGAVAATVIDGETPPRCAKNGSPARDPVRGGRMAAARSRSSSGRSWRAAARPSKRGKAEP